MSARRLYEKAFQRKPLHQVFEGDYCVEHNVYKVLKGRDLFENGKTIRVYDIRTDQNSKFNYSEGIILESAMSATQYNNLETATKTELIKLFNDISLNDIWYATYLKQDTDTDWADELVTKLTSMSKADALAYVKKENSKFGKTTRKLIGQKILPSSDNNYYLVRDLQIYFDELEKRGKKLGYTKAANSKSIRNLDVNTIQSLVYNKTMYVLK